MRRALDPKEIEANVFACNLLMPPRMIRRLMEERPGITATRMAKVFHVPEDIMTAWLVSNSPESPETDRSGGMSRGLLRSAADWLANRLGLVVLDQADYREAVTQDPKPIPRPRPHPFDVTANRGTLGLSNFAARRRAGVTV